MKKVLIYGSSQTAEIANYYISNDTNDEVVGFVVEREHRSGSEFCGLPLFDFEDIEERFSPSSYQLFAPLQPWKMNRFRQRIYEAGKEKGYLFYTYISSKASVLTSEIGENCLILEDNTVQPFVQIGDNCVLWSGNHVGHHSKVGDHVFITSHVVISGNCVVGSNCFFGVNSTVKDGSVLPEGTLIGQASSVVRDPVNEWSVIVGNPGVEKSTKSWRVM